MTIEFTVPGQPQGKGRPKFSSFGGHAHARTPDATVIYENLIKMQFQLAAKTQRFGDDVPLYMSVNCYYQMPKTSNVKTHKMLTHDIRPTSKPDCDNVLKVVADALNSVAYKDDSRIVHASIRKFYGETPRVEVLISDEVVGGESAH